VFSLLDSNSIGRGYVLIDRFVLLHHVYFTIY